MKTAVLVLALLALGAAEPALPHGSTAAATGGDFSCDPPARWAPRHDAEEARLAITTEDGDVTLILTRRVVALQLSDRTFHRVNRELRHKEREDDDEDNPIADAIRTAILSSVRALLDHSAECSIRDVSDVQYRHGELVFTTEGGERLFGHVVLNDSNVMESFSDSDARTFVREFRRLKARTN